MTLPLLVLISPDLQPFVSGLGNTYVLLENQDPYKPDKELILKELIQKYPDIKQGIAIRGRELRILSGCIRYVASI